MGRSGASPGIRMIGSLLIVVSLAAVSSIAQEQKPKAFHEQTVFRPDEPPKHMVPLSRAALRALLRVKAIREIADGTEESVKRDPEQLFQAAKVHLSDAKEADLVVISLPPLTGADNDWFWIVRSAHKSPTVVLFAGANSLELLKGTTNSYRDIRTVWSSASYTTTSIYKFDGKKYTLWREKYKKNLPTTPRATPPN